MTVISKICGVTCPDCGWGNPQYYVNFEDPQGRVCPNCDGQLEITSGARSSAVLPGQFANDVNSELYVRPDKDHPGREMHWSWNKVEKLAGEGKTRPIQEREMKMVKDRMVDYNKTHGEIKLR